jgi:muconate cycloisomerase
MIHLALASPGITADEYPCDIIGPLFYTGDILTRPLPLCGGKALLLEGAGLGVELDEDRVNRYRVM